MKLKVNPSIFMAIVFTGTLFSTTIRKMISIQNEKTAKSKEISVLIKGNTTFQILNEKNKKVMETKSKYRLLRQLSYISRTESITDIPVFMEDEKQALSLVNDIIQDYTMIKDVDYEVAGSNLIVKIQLLEYPSTPLSFKICL